MPVDLADELIEQDVEAATENALISFEEIVLIQTANILNPTNGMQENVRMFIRQDIHYREVGQKTEFEIWGKE